MTFGELAVLHGAHWLDYARDAEYLRRHAVRYRRHVEAHGLPCQDCGGMGGETVPILDDGSGPFEHCGWCEGTGLVTRHMRGVWLRWKQAERAARKAAKAA